MNLSENKTSKKILIFVLIAVLLIAAVVTIFLVNLSRVSEEANRVSRLDIDEFPTLSYSVGQEPDYKGLVVALVKNNGESDRIAYTEETAKDFTITGLDTSKPVKAQVITVSYGGFTASYTVEVKNRETTASLIEISLEVLPKTQYKPGEWLNTDGGIILRKYSDGSVSRTILINDYVDGWDAARQGGVGTYTLTVKYKENGVLRKTTYDITITE